MSSIIACRLPPPEVSTPSTWRGVLSSEVRPNDWASRRAGSTVSTQACLPRSATRKPIAAAAVVLPTPPEPQQTMILVLRSSMIRSMSSLTGAMLCFLRSPLRRGPLARSCRPLLPERVGELVQARQVDPVGDHRQLVVRTGRAQQLIPLPVLHGHLERVLPQLGGQVAGQPVIVADPGR